MPTRKWLKITLPETNSKFAPEKMTYQKEAGSPSNHELSGFFAVTFRQGVYMGLIIAMFVQGPVTFFQSIIILGPGKAVRFREFYPPATSISHRKIIDW